MWTGMKDSRPAPNDFILNLIAGWKKNNTWPSVVDRIKKSTEIISTSTFSLQNFIIKCKKIPLSEMF